MYVLIERLTKPVSGHCLRVNEPPKSEVDAILANIAVRKHAQMPPAGNLSASALPAGKAV